MVWATVQSGDMATNCHISLSNTFTSGDVSEWFKCFKICCVANQLDNATKAVKLLMLPEGEPLAIWLGLSKDKQKDYTELKKVHVLIKKMVPHAFVFLDDFQKWRLYPEEPISVYVHALKKFLDQVILYLDKSAREQLLLHQFLAGIPSEVSKPIRAASDVKSLDQSTDQSRLMMAVNSSTSLQTTTAMTPLQMDTRN